MIVIVEIMPKPGILDPQGKAVNQALHQLGYNEVNEVKVGKIIRLDIDETDHETAIAKAEDMAVRLLHNPNVESFRVVLPEEIDNTVEEKLQ
ncbi:MAG: phosphoribosylformylglycinamidine synthase subunit PurS [Candidatus Electryonea clarkiae]|nr:phosphoribosylformylglycinamidine synthase subunit PurS [Candidatus Electryonea clarkiae]MDP8286348.1 phosphoribosylformylglycinamidine synthase subunit PurS [Candidatus Electryonea clarkiae]